MRLAIAVALTLITAMPARATDDIECRAADNAAWISFVVGTTPGLNPLGLSMGAGATTWSTAKEDGGTLIEVKQAFSTDDEMKIDVISAGKPAAFLRMGFAHEYGQDPVLAGVLHIVDVGAWAVVCGE